MIYEYILLDSGVSYNYLDVIHEVQCESILTLTSDPSFDVPIVIPLLLNGIRCCILL